MKAKHNNKVMRRLVAALIAMLLLMGVTIGICLIENDKISQMEYPMEYQRYVQYYADKYEVDPLLLYSFIRTESGFNASARSKVDARGLMQITEITFDWIKSKIAPTEDLTFDSMYDPETNVRFGSYFVSYCLLRYNNDVSTAAAAYHSGWGTVDNLLADEKYSANGETLDTFPYPQMRQYVAKINSSYQHYQEMYSETADQSDSAASAND